MMRHCDGTDPNLTREVRGDDFDSAAMTVSPWNKGHADRTNRGGYIVINCQCGLRFDDVDRAVIYPHQRISGDRLRGAIVCTRGGNPTQRDLDAVRTYGEYLARRNKP